jgi:DNA (cytosine-5)-methyltransferase 1
MASGEGVRMKHFGDICKLNGAEMPIVDIITGGSPCQDLSVAGKRAGLAGERSGLFMEQIRIIKEMREHDRANRRSNEHIRPRFMVWENVCGAFSSHGGEDFRAVLEETAKVADENAVIPRPTNGKWSQAGCIMGDGWSIAWRVHDAQFWGVPQRRKRIALVADFSGGGAPEILFEREGVSGDIAESREERQGITTATERNAFETIKPLCIGGGQLHDAMTPSTVCKTLNTMADTMKVLCEKTPIAYGIDRASFNQGENALYNFSVEEELAQTLVAKGVGGC